MEGWIFLLWICLNVLLIGLFVRLVDYLFRDKKKYSACMTQWPPEVVERLKREAEGRSIKAFNMIRNERRLKVAEIAKDLEANPFDFKFQPIMGIDPACSDNDYSPTIISGYQDEDGVYHITGVENHSRMTIEEIVERYGPLNSVVDVSVRENPMWKQLEEEQSLKLLACLLRLSQNGNSPYAIGRVNV